MRADVFALLPDYLSSVSLSQRLFSLNLMVYSSEIFYAMSYQRVSQQNSTVICYSQNNGVRYWPIKFLLYKEQDIMCFLQWKN